MTSLTIFSGRLDWLVRASQWMTGRWSHHRQTTPFACLSLQRRRCWTGRLQQIIEATSFCRFEPLWRSDRRLGATAVIPLPRRSTGGGGQVAGHAGVHQVRRPLEHRRRPLRPVCPSPPFAIMCKTSGLCFGAT